MRQRNTDKLGLDYDQHHMDLEEKEMQLWINGLSGVKFCLYCLDSGHCCPNFSAALRSVFKVCSSNNQFSSCFKLLSLILLLWIMQFTENSRVRMQRHTNHILCEWLKTRALGLLMSGDREKLSSGNSVFIILQVLNNNCNIGWFCHLYSLDSLR